MSPIRHMLEQDIPSVEVEGDCVSQMNDMNDRDWVQVIKGYQKFSATPKYMVYN